jgi:ferredoxin--NADP+ reductase
MPSAFHSALKEIATMAEYHVITGKCTKALLCLDACQADAIHPTASEPEMAAAPQLYIDPARCVNCGSCAAVCESEAIYEANELPEELKKFEAINAAF